MVTIRQAQGNDERGPREGVGPARPSRGAARSGAREIQHEQAVGCADKPTSLLVVALRQVIERFEDPPRLRRGIAVGRG